MLCPWIKVIKHSEMTFFDILIKNLIKIIANVLPTSGAARAPATVVKLTMGGTLVEWAPFPK